MGGGPAPSASAGSDEPGSAARSDLDAALARFSRSTGLPAEEIREALRDAEEGRRPRAWWIRLIDAIRAGVPADDLAPCGLAHGGRLYVATPGEGWDIPGVAETEGDTERMRLVVLDLAAIVGLAGPSA